MIRFESDYLEGAHPKIMDALLRTNLEQTAGYGVDEYCDSARAKLLKLCGLKSAGIHFLSGGTQTNLLACAAFLKPWQGVICADTGHIAVHESGSVEATGHKVLTLPAKDGKLNPEDVAVACGAHFSDSNAEAAVQPGMIYISQPTEYGTLYSKAELESLRKICDTYHITLFADGARLVYGLAAPENDVSLQDLARCCDAFYLGGTKAGLLFGEALVIANPALDTDFRHMLKQRGAMLAKGRILGVQFDTMLSDGLYREIGEHAIHLAAKIREELTVLGFTFAVSSPTNQLFPVMDDGLVKRLSDRYSLSFWEKAEDGRNVIRICTSWATRPEAVDALLKDIKEALRP